MERIRKMEKLDYITQSKGEPKLIDSDESSTEDDNLYDISSSLYSINNQFKSINASSPTEDFLVDKLTNLSEYNNAGYYPIHTAIKQNKLHVVEAILKIDPNCCNLITKKDQLTTVELAIKSRSNRKIVRLLLKCFPEELLNHQCKDGTILHLSIINGQLNLTRKILKDYPDLILQRRSLDGSYPIHLAARISDINSITKIVNISSDQLNQVDSNENSCYHNAAMSGNVICLSTIIELVQKHNIQNSNNLIVNKMNYTPLHTASYCGHYGMVKYIINSGNFPNLQRVATSSNELPIHIASEKKHFHIVQLLIQADPTIVNEKRIYTLSNVLPLNMTFNIVNNIPSIKLIKFLIEDNSSAFTVMKSRESPLNKAIRLSGDSLLNGNLSLRVMT